MKQQIRFIIILLLMPILSCTAASSEANKADDDAASDDLYKVGTAKVSLEPDNSVFSLTLGGYAAPADGRFTLTWIYCGPVPTDKRSLFSEKIAHKGREYTIAPDGILYKKVNNYEPWSKIGYKNGITYTIDVDKIAVIDDQLHALTSDGNYYRAEHKSNKDLFATVTAIGHKKETVLLIGLDLTGFDYSMAQKVKEEIWRKKKIPAEAIILNASHTHFTPIVQAWSTWREFSQKPDSIYLNTIVIKNILEAVDIALKDMKKCTISFARTKSVIGHNRALSGADALYDPSVDILRFETPDKKWRSVFFSAACHPVFRNEGEECFTISANFPGVAKRMIEQGFSATDANFFQGCAGDINPLDGNHVNTGTVLANNVLEALKSPQQKISGGISYALETVRIPMEPWSIEQVKEFRAGSAGHEGDIGAGRNVRWADMMLRHYQEGTMPQYLPVYIQTINIGNWKLVGLSREAVTQYSLDIKKLWPDQPVTVAGFSNDISSYLPNRAHVKARNYEGFDSSLWYGQPAFFPENILDIVLDHIQKSNY